MSNDTWNDGRVSPWLMGNWKMMVRSEYRSRSHAICSLSTRATGESSAIRIRRTAYWNSGKCMPDETPTSCEVVPAGFTVVTRLLSAMCAMYANSRFTWRTRWYLHA